jgi:hypothetical protein
MKFYITILTDWSLGPNQNSGKGNEWAKRVAQPPSRASTRSDEDHLHNNEKRSGACHGGQKAGEE